MGKLASNAYAFMDMLPEMSRMQAVFSRVAVGHGIPFPGYRVYSPALDWVRSVSTRWAQAANATQARANRMAATVTETLEGHRGVQL